MKSFPNDIAILVFSQRAKEEAAAKKYRRGFCKGGGYSLAAGLIAHTLGETTRTGLPIIPCFSDKQKGEFFGERLANAIEEAFRSGVSRLIVCGTDTPNLSMRHLLSAAEQLRDENLVLGPAEDGGVYLIGLTKNSFDKDSFRKLPWLTSSVFEALCDYALLSGLTCTIETVEKDIDSFEAIAEWNHSGGANWFSSLIKKLTRLKQTIFYIFNSSQPSPFYTNSCRHRGPPAYPL